MLSAENLPFMVSVVKLNAVMLSVVARLRLHYLEQ
jgi:hypothetical protein